MDGSSHHSEERFYKDGVSVSEFTVFAWTEGRFSAVADPGEGPGRPAPPPPLFVDQIEA